MPARIPLPQQGQPLDVEYIYTLASALNQLVDATSLTVDRTTSVKSRTDNQNHDVRTGDAKIVAGYVNVTGGGESQGQGTSKTWTYAFPQSFGMIPVVTATAVNTGTAGSNVDVSVFISATTRDSVSGSVIFRSPGQYSLDINVIAIGTAPTSGSV